MECTPLRSWFAMLSLCGKNYVKVRVNFNVLTINFSLPVKMRWPDSLGCETKRHASYNSHTKKFNKMQQCIKIYYSILI
jgi:hypothetical protein